MSKLSFYVQVYKVAQQIPPGKVTSYGRIALMLGRRNAARAVGYALSALSAPDSGEPYTSATVPWQRVVNNKGRISIHSRDKAAAEQANLLRAEGVMVDEHGRINLDIYLWEGLHLVELDDILSGKG
ncbi:MAG: MGMT family protein [Anaerolineae bacterium]|nr:MGMT family protein [Anaerolineae bacterium]